MSERIVTTDFLRVLLGEDTVDMLSGIGKAAYKKYPTTYNLVAEQNKTTKRLVELVRHKSLPYAGELAESAQRSHNKMQQLWKTDLYMQYFQSNYIVSWQTLEHLSKAGKIKTILTSIGERAEALAMKKDRAFAAMLNNYDSSVSTQTFGDGKNIGAVDHPTGDGSTFSNLADASADINEVSVEAAVKIIRTWTDTGGKAIKPNPRCIYSGTDLEFDGQRLLQTEYTLGSNFNDKNIISTGKYLPEGHKMSPHINNDGSWFIVTDVQGGLLTYTFKEPMFDMRPLPRSYDTEFVGLDAYVHGMEDPRGVFVYPRS